jgi:hypothetical protein
MYKWHWSVPDDQQTESVHELSSPQDLAIIPIWTNIMTHTNGYVFQVQILSAEAHEPEMSCSRPRWCLLCSRTGAQLSIWIMNVTHHHFCVFLEYQLIDKVQNPNTPDPLSLLTEWDDNYKNILNGGNYLSGWTRHELLTSLICFSLYTIQM